MGRVVECAVHGSVSVRDLLHDLLLRATYAPASRVSAFSYLQPLLATIMAIPLLGENPTKSLVLGGTWYWPVCFWRSVVNVRILGPLRRNRNYRYTWFGQVVSEFGDHFNNIAVFSLALANTRSGIVVSAIMLSRAVPVLLRDLWQVYCSTDWTAAG